MKSFVAALVIAPSLAQAGPLLGEWCHPDHGGVIYVEADSLGIGDHRVCEYAQKPGEETLLQTTIDCVEWRQIDGQWVGINPATHKLFLERLEGGLILARFDEEEWMELEDCGF